MDMGPELVRVSDDEHKLRSVFAHNLKEFQVANLGRLVDKADVGIEMADEL